MAAQEETRQTPCPDRILDDCGSAFAMGCIGGAVWHGIKGMRNSPRGDRIRGGFNSFTLRAPTLGGNFAVWGGLFATFDCTYSYLRGREDPLNAIASGATTGGLLAARAGWKAAGKNALIGGVLLAFIEGMGVMLQKMLAPPEPAQAVLAPPTQGSFNDGMASGYGEDMMGDNVGTDPDAPPPPMFDSEETDEGMYEDTNGSFNDEMDFAMGDVPEEEIEELDSRAKEWS